MKFEANIGLEVHLQLSTKSKAFCSCSAKFGGRPNTQTCPVCLGLPGSLPVLNKDALIRAVKAGLALNCSIAKKMRFDRKNYYYPDLPKNFQVSQYDKPLSQNGFLEIGIGDKVKKIRIKRVHLEEDAGKLFHKKGCSLIDYNRAGTPLLEIVSEPDISSPEEAYAYLTSLKSLLRYLNVSDCNMEEGSLRCDANISLKEKGVDGLGVKAELKNLNSFKGVKNAMDYEIRRQSSILDDGEKITQETRLWDADKGMTISMRRKEEAHDYRYFPEPDLPSFTMGEEMIERIKSGIPELPRTREARFVRQYKIPAYDASILTQKKKIADFFEEAVKIYNRPKDISNWIMGSVSAILNEKNISIDTAKLSPKNLALMVKMVEEAAISIKIAKKILADMIETGDAPDIIVQKKSLSQISDIDELKKIVDKIVKENLKSASDYKSGKKNALIFLVGQVMKATRGKANPGIVNGILKDKLK